MSEPFSVVESEPSNNDNNNISRETNNPALITHMPSHLYRAAANGRIEAFTEMTEHELLNLLTPNRNTVLHIYITACTTYKTRFVEEILRLCPALLRQANAKGDTALHVAARYGHAAIAEYLIRRASERDVEAAQRGTVVGAVSREKDTALHEAVRFRHLGVVRVLTKEDPGFLYLDNLAGETPLYMAAERGYGEIVREILENCSSLWSPSAVGGPNGRTVLHAATVAKDEETTAMILEKLKNLDLTKKADEKGWIPLHHAADLNCLKIVKLLLERDTFTAYMKNKEGMTALHIAASNGHYRIIKEIILRCPDCCELVDNRGWNVLHFAVESRCESAVDFIVRDFSLSNLVNEKDSDGNTPFLHIATSLNFNYSLVAHSRVDKMAFNFENQNALDIVSTNKRIAPYKNHVKRGLRKQGIKSGRRILINKVDHDHNNQKDQRQEQGIDLLSEVMKDKQSTLVAATLIATVTFAAGFTLPGGYESSAGPLQGSAVLRDKASFRAFMVTDTLAMLLSTAAVFINLFLVSHKDKSRMLSYHLVAFLLTTSAMATMVVAFVTGTYAVLAHSAALATATCVIGLSFFVFFFFLYKKTFCDPEIV